MSSHSYHIASPRVEPDLGFLLGGYGAGVYRGYSLHLRYASKRNSFLLPWDCDESFPGYGYFEQLISPHVDRRRSNIAAVYECISGHRPSRKGPTWDFETWESEFCELAGTRCELYLDAIPGLLIPRLRIREIRREVPIALVELGA